MRYRFQLGTAEEVGSDIKDEIREYFHSESIVRIGEEGYSDLGMGMQDYLEENLIDLSNHFPDVEFIAYLTYWDMKNLDIYKVSKGKIDELYPVESNNDMYIYCDYSINVSPNNEL